MFFNLLKVAMVVAAVSVAGTAMAAGGGLHLVPREVTGVVNINTASMKELELLPGIGRHNAGMIVAFREKTPFKTVHELVKVKGIGKGIFARVQNHLSIAGPTTLAVVPRAKAAGAAPVHGDLVAQPAARAK
jgi:competence protein ComEA